MKTLKDFKPPFSVNSSWAEGYSAGAPTFWIEDSNGAGVAACPPPFEFAQELADVLNKAATC